MFESVTLRGAKGSIIWGYRHDAPAAVVTSWRIFHHRPDVAHDARWTLTATITRADRFQLRRHPLLFTAPRLKGFWCWPIHQASVQVGETTLQATLGPPDY